MTVCVFGAGAIGGYMAALIADKGRNVSVVARLQALEGERGKVWTTFKRIEDDERHANVVVVDAHEVPSPLRQLVDGLCQARRVDGKRLCPFDP